MTSRLAQDREEGSFSLESGRLRPAIAKLWEISTDGKEYTFTIQGGVTFSDGMPLTSADIDFTLHGIL